MQPALCCSNRTEYTLPRRRRAQPGFTLVEMLVASLIVAVALFGLVSTWFTMLDSTQTTGDRSAAYEIARLVIERARSEGFSQLNVKNWADFANQVVSRPNGVSDTWISPCITHYRFFDAQGQEIGYSIANTLPAPPSGARYVAQTTISAASQDFVPAARPDLRLQSLRVDVFLLEEDKNKKKILGRDLCDLETLLTEGGIQ